ncbi:hypothetical protein SAMN05444170_4387 [Bradyrhizobium erythrophlei]|uniref:Uncharacterized protein n=1 Tax=Bradyrhizobium erythrophlei TaxID=1437360 RepID=A0A1M7UBQ7_9BRAD|nr:hypothetical protein SAMN05444170_4387 [Bradyrhizobium erythrophlei]
MASPTPQPVIVSRPRARSNWLTSEMAVLTPVTISMAIEVKKSTANA